MSNFQDYPSVSTKPIQRVEDCLIDIHKKLDCMKVDVGTIKSDLKIILDRIKQKQQHEDEILKHQVKKQDDLAKGWFFTY
jgi:hypothetical protein